MIPYWLLWSLPASGALGWLGGRRWNLWLAWGLAGLVTLMVGLRFEVGGDWGNYFAYLDNAFKEPFSYVLACEEPGYVLLNWVGSNYGGGIFLVNLLCGVLFAIGLIPFCRAQPRPWLALTLAVPYLIIVVAMGYSRQGVAIGLEMIGLLWLGQGRLIPFLGAVMIAASFHRTALILAALGLLVTDRENRTALLLRLLLTVLALGGGASSLLASTLETYAAGYLEAEYSSSGAAVRIALCFLPGITFLLNRRRFRLATRTRQIWSWLSWGAVAALGLLLVSPSSTAVDRMALYLIPLQLFVGARLPDLRLFALPPRTWVLLLVLLSAAVQFVWLNFGSFSAAWLPYRNWLWEG